MKKPSRKTIGFILALAVPLIILLSLTVKPLLTITAGEDITLKTVPVDPTDLFYGDYVTLQYEIEEVPKEKISKKLLEKLAKNTAQKNIKVYGKLVEENGVYVLDELLDKKPLNTIYLTGKVYPYTYLSLGEVEVYDVNFNLDRFFVPENTGMELEDLSRQGQLIAHIKVRNGFAVLKSIEEAK